MNNTSSSISSSPSFPPSADRSDPELALLHSLNIVEFVLHLLLECPFSALNFYLVLSTSILHPNLKFVLLCQSGCIFLRGFVRLLILTIGFCLSDLFWSNTNVLVFRLTMAPIYFRNFVAHVLVVERVMATLMARSYERRRGWHFSAGWFALVATLTAINLLANPSTDPNLISWLTFGGGLTVAFCEILVFVCLCKYNINNYHRQFEKVQDLSERYQLSENIRTTKQMMPPLMLHFANLLIGATSATLLFYKPFTGLFAYDLVGMITLISVTVSNFLIELTMIIYHPFLRRNALNLVPFWAKSAVGGRVGPSGTDLQHNHHSVLLMTDMHGAALVRPMGQNEHFAMLAKDWEQGAKALNGGKHL